MKRWTWKLVAAGCAALAGAATMLVVTGAGTPRGRIAEGVRVAGLDIGGKRVARARAEIAEWRGQRLEEEIVLALPSAGQGARARSWSPTRRRLGFDVDVDATLAAARIAGERAGPWQRVMRRLGRGEPVTVEPAWRVDEKTVRRYLAGRVAPVVARAPRDARLLFRGSGFSVASERDGLGIDVAAAARDVLAMGVKTRPERVTLRMRTVRPSVTARDLDGIEGEVARFSTHYSERGNRSRNIELACERINGVVLKPGGVFSYNKVVGPRDSEAGFRTAPVIVRGRLEPGLGGGVCQVSTTLYNAALLADLKIVQRRHHGFPVHYVPAGRDATVAYGSIDFQFQNNTDAPIAIAASGSGGQVVMRLFGKRVPGRQVRIERSDVGSWGSGATTVRDSSLPAGTRRVVESGRSGHRATVWRIVTVDGRETRREVVSRDTYRAFPAVVAVGTGSAAPVPSGSGASRLPIPAGGAGADGSAQRDPVDPPPPAGETTDL